MAAEKEYDPRPLWVRWVVRAEMKRTAALALVSMFGLLTAIGLLAAAIESASSSFLGALAVPIGLAGAGLCAAGAVWSWLAVRWVDRNGKWQN